MASIQKLIVVAQLPTIFFLIYIFLGKHNNKPNLTSHWHPQAHWQNANKGFTYIPLGLNP
jgi:hypothetical protein